jgi:hypothetical protein
LRFGPGVGQTTKGGDLVRARVKVGDGGRDRG